MQGDMTPGYSGHPDRRAEEKESGDEVQWHSPFELGAKNIDWLYEMYEAVWHQLRETNNVESQIEEP